MADKEPQQVREILEAVTDKVPKLLGEISEVLPKLLTDLMGTIYSEQSAERLAKSIATFYKGLKEGGIPEDMAVRMTRDYAANLSLTELVSSARRAAEK